MYRNLSKDVLVQRIVKKDATGACSMKVKVLHQ